MTTEIDESIPLTLPVPSAVQAPVGRVIIPSSSPTTTLEDNEPSLVTPNPNAESLSEQRNVCGSKTKVGRWTEQEHLVFLDGLKLYGKQWKMIAGMIGTRTVVQVRTHAQKYFMKMERKGTPAATIVPNKSPRPVKRKSLPSPSSARSKSRKATQRLSLPLTIGGATTMISSLPDLQTQDLDPTEPPQLPSFPSCVSHSSSSNGSDWSIISPDQVSNVVDLQPSVENYDLMEDPLEWLISGDTQQYLPESSLPMFPDLKSDKVVASAAPSIDEPMEPKGTSAIDDLDMEDPNITMQSLFMNTAEVTQV